MPKKSAPEEPHPTFNKFICILGPIWQDRLSELAIQKNSLLLDVANSSVRGEIRAQSKAEPVAQMCSVKKVFLEILQNSQENTYARVSLLIKLQASDRQLY